MRKMTATEKLILSMGRNEGKSQSYYLWDCRISYGTAKHFKTLEDLGLIQRDMSGHEYKVVLTEKGRRAEKALLTTKELGLMRGEENEG